MAEEEKTLSIKERVLKCRTAQMKRYNSDRIYNSKADLTKFKDSFEISDSGRKILKKSFESMGMSARGYEKILRIARTIADMEGSREIQNDHILESIQYRTLDRKYWR